MWGGMENVWFTDCYCVYFLLNFMLFLLKIFQGGVDYFMDSCFGGRNDVFWNVRGLTSPEGGACACTTKHFVYGFHTSESCAHFLSLEDPGYNRVEGR